MARDDSPTDEPRYVKNMGVDLGRVFFRLSNECGYLHVKWQAYVALFGTNENRVALLNRAAAGFTRMLQDMLWEDVLLHICRMTDRATIGNNDTLTVKQAAAP